MVRTIFEEGIFPQYHTMDGPTEENTSNIQQSNIQQSNAQQDRTTNNIFQGDGFTVVNGVYNISDPTNVTANPFINPATGERYPSYRPYSTNLHNALRTGAELKYWFGCLFG